MIIATQAHAADERIALVIGASDYGPKAKLPHAVADAELFAETLKHVGFQEGNIKVLKNPDTTTMQRALDAFYIKANGIVGKGLAVVYFAGHGVQIRGQSHLIPIDQQIIDSNFDEIKIFNRSIQAQEIIDRLRDTKIADVAVFLDACREIKGQKSYPGLRKLELERGGSASKVIVSSATSAGNVTSDGIGPNSIYTTALSKELLVSGRTIVASLGAVNSEVNRLTKGSQLPEVQGVSEVILVEDKITVTALDEPLVLRKDNDLERFGGGGYRSDSQPTKAKVTYSYIAADKKPMSAFTKYRDAMLKSVGVGMSYTISQTLLNELEAESDAGSADASLILAVNYGEEFMGGTINIEKYTKFIKRAIVQGHSSAVSQYAKFLCCDKKGPHNVAEATSWLDAGIASGNNMAIIQRGHMYRDGIGSEHNIAKAEELYSKAAANGDERGSLANAEMYYYSDYGQVNFKKALDYYNKVSGFGSYADKIGRIVRFGVEPNGVDADPDTALGIFLDGTKNSCLHCWLEIANLLSSGELKNVQREAVFAAYSHSEGVNDANGIFEMALMLDNGDGTAKDSVTATQKFIKAADLGHRASYFYAGTGLANGVGIAPDPVRAAKYLRLFVAIDYDPDLNIRFNYRQDPIVSAARLLADLIEDKKISAATPTELPELRSRYGTRNSKSIGFQTKVGCGGKFEFIYYTLWDWNRPNDETALDIAAEIERHYQRCVVAPADIVELKALKKQARETGKSFIELIIQRFPPMKPSSSPVTGSPPLSATPPPSSTPR